jgi:hypothetical protein
MSTAAFCLALLFVTTMTIIRAQPYDDHTIRAILLPSDCNAPCFIGIQPGLTQSKEAYALMEASPWVSEMSSHIASGCCSIALNWQWNGKQPINLENGNNTVYFSYNASTGIQTVQNIVLHTQIPAGYTILVLGAWPTANSAALQGLDYAYVEVFYPQYSVRLATTISCPLSRWRLWEAPMTLEFNRDAWSMSGMKHISEVC